MHEAEQKGLSCELIVATAMNDAGLIVSFPLSRGKYDLVVDCGSLLHRVQVKKALYMPPNSNARGKHEGARYSVDLSGGGGGGHKRYAMGVFDYLAVVCNLGGSSGAHVYMIPTSKLCLHGRMLRQFSIKPPEFLQNTREDSLTASRRWEQYRNNWKLERR